MKSQYIFPFLLFLTLNVDLAKARNSFFIMKAISPFIFRNLCVRTAFAQTTKAFSSNSEDIQQKIDKWVKQSKVVVFMKGEPKYPLCGFSNTVVQILQQHGVKFDSYDVIANEEIRNAIKEYSQWPTIPQVFINGEFVGGCDIMLNMNQTGELVEKLKAVGITSRLATDKKEEKKE